MPEVQNNPVNAATENRVYGENYKVYGDGNTPAVAVGNCNTFNGRRIINLNFKTMSDVRGGYSNATYSYPVEARGRVSQQMVDDMHRKYGHLKRGDYVSAVIVGDKVTKLLPLAAIQSKEINISKLPAKQEDAAEQVDAPENLMPPTDEQTDADDAAETPAEGKKLTKAEQKKLDDAAAAKAEAQSEANPDLPF
jgi:hypothetical protein